MGDYGYEHSDDFESEVREMQQAINSGMCWKLEGSYGRAAMEFIESGFCTLGPVRVSDYYGSPIGSRDDVVAGTKGSVSYSRSMQPDFWEGRSDTWAD